MFVLSGLRCENDVSREKSGRWDEKRLRNIGLDVCIFTRFKVNCEVMPLRSFANFKLRMSRHRKNCARPQKARGPGPWPIWPMRKSVTAYVVCAAA